MGTIAEKLTYLDETRENIRQGINSIGGNLTNSDTFRSYSDAIDEIYDKFPKVEGEGSSITLENTMEASIKSELNGNTTQNGTPTPTSPQPINVVSGRQEVSVVGKNLFDKTNYPMEQGSFNYNTNANQTSDNRIRSPFFEIQPNTTYTLSCNEEIGEFAVIYKQSDASTIIAGMSGNTTNKYYTFTTPSNAYFMRFRIGSATYVKTYTTDYEIQLEQGSTASEYEEYKSQSYEINLGKNLFDKSSITWVRNNSDNYTSTENTNTARIRTQQLLKLTGGETYTISGIPNEITLGRIKFYASPSSTSVSSYTDTSTFTVPTNATYVIFQMNGTNFTDETNTLMANASIQVEKGSQVSSYSPYKTPIELCKIGTYQDRIYKENGTWYLHKEIGKVVLNGSENITLQNIVNDIAGFRIPTPSNVKPNTDTYSNYYKGSNWDTYWFNRIYGVISSHNNNITNTLYASAPDSSITTENQMKTWLSTHNTIVYYVLATPTTTEITDSELIEQLAEFGDAKSYEGTTNINVDGDLPTILNVKALEDIFSQ